tara:strand:- start:67 stop:333 length:267 start_codon:yes stop_codon:yes gene_type:complete
MAFSLGQRFDFAERHNRLKYNYENECVDCGEDVCLQKDTRVGCIDRLIIDINENKEMNHHYPDPSSMESDRAHAVVSSLKSPNKESCD